MNKKQLEQQSNVIDAMLADNKIYARVDGGRVTPYIIVFNVSEPLPNSNGLSDSLAKALHVPGVTIAGNTITVKRTDSARISLLALLDKLERCNSVPPVFAMLGLCDNGAPLLVRLPSYDVGHILINGAGASDLLRTIAVSLAVCNRPRDMRLVFIGSIFDDLRRLPHAQHITLSDLARLTGRKNRVPRIVILMDAVSVDAGLQQILIDGHAAGMNVIASGSMSSGFTTRIEATRAPGDFVINGFHFTAATITPAEIDQVILGALPKRGMSRLESASMIVNQYAER